MLGYINTLFKYFYYLFLYVYDILFYVFVKKISFFNLNTAKEYNLFKRTSIFLKKISFLKLLENRNFLTLDILENSLFFFKKSQNLNFSRYVFRNKLYFKKTSNLLNEKKIFKNQFMSGLYSIHNALKYWYLPLILSILTIYIYICSRVVSVNTMLFQWFVLGMFAYWLLSGFVFFIKKYRFTRFTSSIQRFWRRSYILFWLIESCLLIVFFYLTINATQEPAYMLDQIGSFKTHTYSWKYFLPKLFLLSILIVLGYIFLLNIKYNIFNKNIIFLVVISLILTYLLWTEFYQIYHVSNFYANLYWNYDVEEKFWSIDSDARRTRIVNHYVMILFLLKFWHIVIIYAFWIFFLLRSNELGRTRYPLYSVNFQNFIILYIMTWLFMYPWLKLILHRFIEVPYFWFYVNNRDLFFRVFVLDIKLLVYSLLDFSFFKEYTYFYKNFDFFYWISSDYSTGFNNFRKHTIRNIIINGLIK